VVTVAHQVGASSGRRVRSAALAAASAGVPAAATTSLAALGESEPTGQPADPLLGQTLSDDATPGPDALAALAAAAAQLASATVDADAGSPAPPRKNWQAAAQSSVHSLDGGKHQTGALQDTTPQRQGNDLGRKSAELPNNPPIMTNKNDDSARR
jgi:hypothetical protein